MHKVTYSALDAQGIGRVTRFWKEGSPTLTGVVLVSQIGFPGEVWTTVLMCSGSLGENNNLLPADCSRVLSTPDHSHPQQDPKASLRLWKALCVSLQGEQDDSPFLAFHVLDSIPPSQTCALHSLLKAMATQIS